MQVPIVSGIYTDASPDFRTSYPLNMQPIPKAQGISEGYLRVCDGLLSEGTGPGTARGGINWDGVCYRVMGGYLISVNSDGTWNLIGNVGDDGNPVSMTYSFDRLAVASNGGLFYWDGTTFSQVTDTDLGTALDVIFVDGYFMTTDGENLVVTELGDPFAVDPLKYGSSEVDPDPIVAVKKIRNEVFAVNRYSIETFSNIGGTGFPFQTIRGAQIHRGAVGTHAVAVFGEKLAFVGGALNEPPAVWLGINGGSVKISTREIDEVLQGYTEAQLADAITEVTYDKGNHTLLIHLSDQTLCYDEAATAAMGQQAWYFKGSSATGAGEYRGRFWVWANDKWMVADSQSGIIGRSSKSNGAHWGNKVRWEFGTPIIYNGGKGAIVTELEVVTLTGEVAAGSAPVITTEYSTDGTTWSDPRSVTLGDRNKRIRWLRQGMLRNWRIQRFKGTSDAMVAVPRLEASMEALAW